MSCNSSDSGNSPTREKISRWIQATHGDTNPQKASQQFCQEPSQSLTQYVSPFEIFLWKTTYDHDFHSTSDYEYRIYEIIKKNIKREGAWILVGSLEWDAAWRHLFVKTAPQKNTFLQHRGLKKKLIFEYDR